MHLKCLAIRLHHIVDDEGEHDDYSVFLNKLEHLD